MKLVVGLGTPGRRYAATRHNVGFRIVECFAEQRGIALATSKFDGRFGRGQIRLQGGEALDVGVLQPQTYMNTSGGSVCEALRFLPIEDPKRDLLVVFDDVDLPFGRLRIRPRVGAAGHKGLAHVIERLGHSDFARLRFGVGRPISAMDTADYVLQRFGADEERALADRVVDAAEALGTILVEGLPVAMNRYNRDPIASNGLEGSDARD